MLSLSAVFQTFSEQTIELDEHYHFNGLGMQAGTDGADEDCKQSKGSDDEYRDSRIAVCLTMWLVPAPST